MNHTIIIFCIFFAHKFSLFLKFHDKKRYHITIKKLKYIFLLKTVFRYKIRNYKIYKSIFTKLMIQK